MALKKLTATDSVQGFAGIDASSAELLARHCSIYNLSDLALFPPFRHAQTLCRLKGKKTLSEQDKLFIARTLRRLPGTEEVPKPVRGKKSKKGKAAGEKADVCQEKMMLMREVTPQMSQALHMVFGMETIAELADFTQAQDAADAIAQEKILSFSNPDIVRERFNLGLLLALSLALIFVFGFFQKENWRKGKGAKPEKEKVSSSVTSESAPVTAEKTGETREYTVKKGDSFYRIAKRELGSSLRVREIYKLNPEKAGKIIYPGDALLLPLQ